MHTKVWLTQHLQRLILCQFENSFQKWHNYHYMGSLYFKKFPILKNSLFIKIGIRHDTLKRIWVWLKCPKISNWASVLSNLMDFFYSNIKLLSEALNLDMNSWLTSFCGNGLVVPKIMAFSYINNGTKISTNINTQWFLWI